MYGYYGVLYSLYHLTRGSHSISNMLDNDLSSEPLTILQIASGDLWAGAETQLYYLATALNGFPCIQLHVVLLNDGFLNKKLTEKGVSVTVLDEKKFNVLVLLYKITKLAFQINADVIHTHRYKENILGGIASLLHSHSKCIRTVHGAPEYNVSNKVRQGLIN